MRLVVESRVGRFLVTGAALAGALAALPATAVAQRNPAYEAARRQGLVGERIDGYLGFVGQPSADLRAMIEDINIRRRAVYADKARTANATVAEYAFTAACRQIARTVPGEKYEAPDGSWRTRTAEPPVRHPRCP
jgi:uncharacterized protein